MKIDRLKTFAYLFAGFTIITACSKSGNQEVAVSQPEQIAQPAEKPGKLPQMDEIDMAKLNQFDPSKSS